MTDPKLREARIAEAKRRTEIDRKGSVSWSWKDTFANHLASLYESDWRPEPEVDAVEAAFKVWDQAAPSDARFLDAFRAGHAHATCADVRRMDWLEGQDVTISWTFNHIPERSEPLRTKIDRAMEGGE